VGDPNWQVLMLNTPEGVSQMPSGLLQKHALSGFSSGVPKTLEGGTNLNPGMPLESSISFSNSRGRALHKSLLKTWTLSDLVKLGAKMNPSVPLKKSSVLNWMTQFKMPYLISLHFSPDHHSSLDFLS